MQEWTNLHIQKPSFGHIITNLLAFGSYVAKSNLYSKSTASLKIVK